LIALTIFCEECN